MTANWAKYGHSDECVHNVLQMSFGLLLNKFLLCFWGFATQWVWIHKSDSSHNGSEFISLIPENLQSIIPLSKSMSKNMVIPWMGSNIWEKSRFAVKQLSALFCLLCTPAKLNSTSVPMCHYSSQFLLHLIWAWLANSPIYHLKNWLSVRECKNICLILVNVHVD